MLPIYAASAATGQGILYGKDAVSKNLKKGDRVYYGHVASGYTGSPLWRIGSPKTSNTNAPNAMFLISERTWRGPASTMPFNANGSQAWQGSDGQKWCASFYDANFSTDDKNNIVSYAKTDKTGTYFGNVTVTACSLTASDKVFWLSVDELYTYLSFNPGSKVKAYDANGTITAYWLRSPLQKKGYVADVESYTGSIAGNLPNSTEVRAGDDQLGYVTMPYAARPAFNISTSDILFASAIGAKSEEVGTLHSPCAAGKEYKLTFKDPSLRITIKKVTNDGSTVTVNYSDAAAGNTSYVSGMILNNGTVKYYGRLAKNAASGSVIFPASYLSDGDTFYLFSEKSSGRYDTDYASEPVAVNIPKADPVSGGGSAEKGATAVAANYAISKMTTDKDIKGSSFAPLKLRSDKQNSNSIRLKWSKPDEAVNYVIYGNLCNTKKKTYRLQQIKTLTTTKTNIKNLKKGKYYKFVVVAFDANGNVVSTSKTIHVTTRGGNGTNHKGVKVPALKKSGMSVKAGKSRKLKARAIGGNVKKHSGLRYESSDPSIATVKKGKVKGISKGTCKVYAYAQNGKYKAVKVTVQ